MARIPLGHGEWSRKVAKEISIPCANRYFEDNPTNLEDQVALIARPGLKYFDEVGSGPIRAIFTQPGSFDGALFVVSGDSLYRMDEEGNVIQIGGDIALGRTPSICCTARIGSVPEYLYIADGTHLHIYSEGSVLTPVAVPDNLRVISTVFIASYVIVVTDGDQGVNGRFYWIEPGSTVIDPLNFATAEKDPDPVFSSRVVGDQLWLLGTNSIEIWYPTGDFAVPFIRVQGRVFDRGTWEGSDAQLNDSLVTVDLNGTVYEITQGGPQRISNPFVEEHTRGALATNKRCSSWAFSMDGHDFYLLNISDESTLVFDLTTREWSRWYSEEGGETWRPSVGVQWNNFTGGLNHPSKILVGDSLFNRLWSLDPSQPFDELSEGSKTFFTRKVLGGLPALLRESFRIGAAKLVAETGKPAYEGASFTLRTSDDNGASWLNHGEVEVKEGDFASDISWRSLGTVRYPGRLFEISDKGASVRIDGLDVR